MVRETYLTITEKIAFLEGEIQRKNGLKELYCKTTPSATLDAVLEDLNTQLVSWKKKLAAKEQQIRKRRIVNPDSPPRLPVLEQKEHTSSRINPEPQQPSTSSLGIDPDSQIVKIISSEERPSQIQVILKRI